MNMFKKQSMRTVHGLQCYFFNQNNCIKVTFYPRRHYRTIWVFGMGNSGKTQQCALQLATVSGKMVETPDLCHLIQFMHPTIYAWGLSVLSLSTRSSSTFFIYSRSNFFFFLICSAPLNTHRKNIGWNLIIASHHLPKLPIVQLFFQTLSMKDLREDRRAFERLKVWLQL